MHSSHQNGDGISLCRNWYARHNPRPDNLTPAPQNLPSISGFKLSGLHPIRRWWKIGAGRLVIKLSKF
jgi:hypothetical protein